MNNTYADLLAKLEGGSPITKSQPTSTGAHYNVPLSNIVVAYMQRAKMVSEAIFPVVPVSKQSDLFYKYDIDTFYRDDAKPRAPGSESAGGGFSFSTDNYACLVEAYHKDIDSQLRANADTQLQLDRAAAEFVAQKMVLRRETRFLSTFFKTGVWGVDWTGVASGATTNQFLQFDASGSDPRATIEAAKLYMLALTGYEPNVALFGAQVMSKLVTNTAVKDQFKYTSAQSINEQMVAAYLGLDNVYVSKSVVATGAEGAAATVGLQAGKHVLLAYRAPAPSVLAPSAGYTFSWTGLTGGGISTSRFPMVHLKSERIESEMAYDFKVVAPALGVFLSGAVA
jgi:hypothetical protein